MYRITAFFNCITVYLHTASQFIQVPHDCISTYRTTVSFNRITIYPRTASLYPFTASLCILTPHHCISLYRITAFFNRISVSFNRIKVNLVPYRITEFLSRKLLFLHSPNHLRINASSYRFIYCIVACITVCFELRYIASYSAGITKLAYDYSGLVLGLKMCGI